MSFVVVFFIYSGYELDHLYLTWLLMGFGWFGFCYLFPILTFPLFLFFFMWINWVLKNILFYRHYYLINYTTLSVAVSLAFIVYIFNVACHQITWYHWLYLSSWTPKSLQMVTAAMKLKDPWSLEEKIWPNKTAY